METQQIMERIIAVFETDFEKNGSRKRRKNGRRESLPRKIDGHIRRQSRRDEVLLPEQIEATAEERESVAEHEKFLKEQAAVKLVRGLRKRHRGRNLAAEFRQKPNERI
jgi:hypothetical protein